MRGVRFGKDPQKFYLIVERTIRITIITCYKEYLENQCLTIDIRDHTRQATSDKSPSDTKESYFDLAIDIDRSSRSSDTSTLGWQC
jgi:hypothetical protein